jgi:hypothetical protein
VRAIGEAVFDLIEAEPAPLREVTGIGPRRSCAIGAVLPRARSTAQEAHRLGPPADPAGPLVAVRPRHRVPVGDIGSAAPELLSALAPAQDHRDHAPATVNATYWRSGG